MDERDRKSLAAELVLSAEAMVIGAAAIKQLKAENSRLRMELEALREDGTPPTDAMVSDLHDGTLQHFGRRNWSEEKLNAFI